MVRWLMCSEESQRPANAVPTARCGGRDAAAGAAVSRKANPSREASLQNSKRLLLRVQLRLPFQRRRKYSQVRKSALKEAVSCSLEDRDWPPTASISDLMK